MKTRTSSWAAGLVGLAAACSGNTVDSGGAQPVSSAPIAGTVAGASFAPKSVEVRKEGGRWFFTLRSYASTCGTSTGAPLNGPELVVVTVGDVAGQAGTVTLAYADGHGATFQTGVYEQGKGTPTTTPVTSGTLRFDTWTETPGATLTGAAKLVGQDSDVEGTFTATVCPPRG
jgi:hypothetical protein